MKPTYPECTLQNQTIADYNISQQQKRERNHSRCQFKGIASTRQTAKNFAI
jgi:hypothetical protein